MYAIRSYYDVNEAIQWAIDNDMDVISMSLGSSYDSTSQHALCDAACGKGIVLVASAGNDYGGAVSYPAAYDSVIAVSATNYTDGIVITSYSIHYTKLYDESGIIDVRAIDENKLKKMNLKNDLEEKGLYKNGKPLDRLKQALEIQNKIFETVSVEVPQNMISKDLFMYYLTKSSDERTRSNVFPSVILTPSLVV